MLVPHPRLLRWSTQPLMLSYVFVGAVVAIGLELDLVLTLIEDSTFGVSGIGDAETFVITTTVNALAGAVWPVYLAALSSWGPLAAAGALYLVMGAALLWPRRRGVR